MAFFRIPKRIVEGVQALEDVSTPPPKKTPARKGAYDVADGVVTIPNDKFSGDFLKLVKYCEGHALDKVTITDPLRPDFSVRFVVGGDFNRDDPQNTVQFLRERGVAATLGVHDRVAIIGGNRRFYGYLQKEADLPQALAQHAAAQPDADSVLTVRTVTIPTEQLPAGQASSNSISTAYKLYESLRTLPTNGDCITIVHIIGERPVPAFKIWRPDAPIDVSKGADVTLGKVSSSYFHKDPAMLRVSYGVGLEHQLTAIVTAPDYKLSPDQVVVATPFVIAGLERTVPLLYLDSTYHVEKHVARLGSLKDHWTLLVDQRPAAKLYKPDAPIEAGPKGNLPWSRITTIARLENLAEVFHKAEGPVVIVPEWWETTKPSRIAIMAPIDSKP